MLTRNRLPGICVALLLAAAGLSARGGTPQTRPIDSQLERLDSRTFRDREAAMAALRKMGVPALKLLRAEASKPHSPEARQRIEKLIDDIRSADQPKSLPLEAELLKDLKAAKNKRADSIIDALASNSGDAWVVREARSIREHRK